MFPLYFFPRHRTCNSALPALARAGIASYTLDPLFDAARPQDRPDFAAGSEARQLAPGVPRVPKNLPSLEREVSAPCETERPRDVEVRLRCRSESAGYLVIAESWSPRFRVRIDGEERPLLRLNHAFQGVAVAPGDEEIRFRYEASPLTRASITISALSWLSLLGFGGIALLRRRRTLMGGRGLGSPQG